MAGIDILETIGYKNWRLIRQAEESNPGEVSSVILLGKTNFDTGFQFRVGRIRTESLSEAAEKALAFQKPIKPRGEAAAAGSQKKQEPSTDSGDFSGFFETFFGKGK